MPKVIFGPLASKARGWSVLLDSPKQTYSSNLYSEIVPLLEILESEARAGRWVVLMLSYEAAPAFDPHLLTHPPNEFPLLWASVFDDSSAVGHHDVGTYELTEWQPAISREAYSDAVADIRELIARGDTYQVNFTFPMTASFHGDSLSWYSDLCEGQLADYCVYLEIEGHTVLCISPELFFERTDDKMLVRPMKGTSKRGRWSTEDAELARALSNSHKQQAENVMIVDLLRNDLGKISVAGSVEVNELFRVERYPTLLQMTSSVRSRLKPNTSLVEIITALFPCGSITGAPKIRTMEIIKELEPFPRRIYTGTIGLIKPGGDCTFNVAIRTVLLDTDSGAATFGVGGGITYSSTAENEYQECILKASFLNARNVKHELFETILLQDGEYYLLDRHIARLRLSADYFDVSFDESAIFNALESVRQSHRAADWKVRLILHGHGDLTCADWPLEKPSDGFLVVGVADQRVNSSDVSLYHKLTANLGRYQSDLAKHPEWDDVILLNERGEITESTIANIVVKGGGRLLTPPVSSGLLPGTFREELIANRRISEAVITLDDLIQAKEIYLINSVRKWRRARLAPASEGPAKK